MDRDTVRAEYGLASLRIPPHGNQCVRARVVCKRRTLSPKTSGSTIACHDMTAHALILLFFFLSLFSQYYYCNDQQSTSRDAANGRPSCASIGGGRECGCGRGGSCGSGRRCCRRRDASCCCCVGCGRGSQCCCGCGSSGCHQGCSISVECTRRGTTLCTSAATQHI